MTHPSGHIEHVANQWRCHDHTTGGVWVYDSEDRAQRCLRALELRDAAQALLKSTRAKLQAAIAKAEEEEAVFTVHQLRKILAELG